MKILRATWSVLRAALAAARAIVPCLPFLLRVAVSARWHGFWLRWHGTKCGVCGGAFTRSSVFRFHHQMQWTCSECFPDLTRAERAINRAHLHHIGVELPPEDASDG